MELALLVIQLVLLVMEQGEQAVLPVNPH